MKVEGRTQNAEGSRLLEGGTSARAARHPHQARFTVAGGAGMYGGQLCECDDRQDACPTLNKCQEVSHES